jgi:hypothetical protein
MMVRPVNLLSTACKFTAGADAVALSELHAGHDDDRFRLTPVEIALD